MASGIKKSETKGACQNPTKEYISKLIGAMQYYVNHTVAY